MSLIEAVNVRDYLSPRYWPHWILLGLMRLGVMLPLRWMERIGSALGTGLYYLAPSRRRIAEVNLRLAFPDADETEIRRLMKASFANLGIAVFETGMSWWEEDKLTANTDVVGAEHLKAAQEKGRGIILFSVHFTCLEVAGPTMKHLIPLQVMYKKARNPLINAFMCYHRAKSYQAIVSHREPRKMIQGLKEGKASWYAPDQDFGRNGTIFAPLFGTPAATLTAPARMARISKAPVVPYVLKRLGNGKGYRLTIQPALEGFPSGDEQTDAERINQEIETLIRQNPEQYLWVHKRYKTRPEGMPSLYRK